MNVDTDILSIIAVGLRYTFPFPKKICKLNKKCIQRII